MLVLLDVFIDFGWIRMKVFECRWRMIKIVYNFVRFVDRLDKVFVKI